MKKDEIDIWSRKATKDTSTKKRNTHHRHHHPLLDEWQGCRDLRDRDRSSLHFNVAEAAAKAGAALEIACKRKIRETAAACLAEGIVFLPFAFEKLGGLHQGAVSQVKLLGSALARCKGMDEGEAIGQLFGRISLTLMKANALMLFSRCQEADFPSPSVDGILWMYNVICPMYSISTW